MTITEPVFLGACAAAVVLLVPEVMSWFRPGDPRDKDTPPYATGPDK